jgi:hypothetical protein
LKIERTPEIQKLCDQVESLEDRLRYASPQALEECHKELARLNAQLGALALKRLEMVSEEEENRQG